jgi:hypothetical protein
MTHQDCIGSGVERGKEMHGYKTLQIRFEHRAFLDTLRCRTLNVSTFLIKE